MTASGMLSIFDGKPPSSTNRPNAGEVLTPRTPLLLRGHTMGRSAAAVADGERRGSGVSHSTSALLPGPPSSPRRAPSVRAPAFNMDHMLAAGGDELDGLLTPRGGRTAASRLASARELPAGRDQAPGVSVAPHERAPLVLQAALALWQLREEARGFRKWKDVLAEPLDLRAQLPVLPPGVTTANEARRLLLNAETKRQITLQSGSRSSNSPAALAAVFSRAESNLLVLWAREAHAKSFRDVDDLTLREVVRHLRLRQYQDGEPLFFEGDAGDRFFLLLDGTVAVYAGASAATKSRQPTAGRVEDLAALGRRVFTYRSGESFGETALFSADATRSASAVAAGACELLELARDEYARTLQRFHRQHYERARRLHFAQRVPLFRDWPRPRVAAVADALELRKLSFGDRLLAEGAVAPAACFLVLGGQLKLTTLIALDDTDGDHSGDYSDEKAASPRRLEVRRGLARRGGAAVAIALHLARPGEFVALEAVLNPGSRARYSAVADAADVEVYALAEADARSLLGGAGSVVYQQLRLMADAAAEQRQRRLDRARIALKDRRQRPRALAKLDGGGFCDAELLRDGEDGERDRLEAEPEQERQQQQCDRAVAAELTTYVAHLDSSRLLAAAVGASMDGRRLGRGEESRLDPEVSAVAAPRMLSSCVKNFVFAHSDTLASDYAGRLALQLPLPSPRQSHTFLLSTSPVAGAVVTSRPSDCPGAGSPSHLHHHRRTRPQQQLLGQHMRRLYETKMHWDASRKSFVLVPPPTTDSTAIDTIPPTKARSATATTAGAEPLYRQQRAAQETARRLLDERVRKQSERRAPLPGKAVTTSSFVHFF